VALSNYADSEALERPCLDVRDVGCFERGDFLRVERDAEAVESLAELFEPLGDGALHRFQFLLRDMAVFSLISHVVAPIFEAISFATFAVLPTVMNPTE